MKTQKLLIFGGTGFIGKSLAIQFLQQSWEVVIIGRPDALLKCQNESLFRSHPAHLSFAVWDGETLAQTWTQHLEQADLVINLAGKSVNCRYTEKNKKAVLESRVHTTRLIGEAIDHCKYPPELWINAGSSTIYRHSLDTAQTESGGTISEWKKDNMPFSLFDQLRFQQMDFSVMVCKAWEDSFWKCSTPYTRKICLRIAITLGRGGVMEPYRMLAKWGLGGHQGTGRQKLSWVHIKDIGRACQFLFDQKELNGIFNLAAPEVATNQSFTTLVRKTLNRSFGLNASNEMLELGALIIGTETELMLKSRWVYPQRLLEAGFQFQYPELGKAVPEILQHWNKD